MNNSKIFIKSISDKLINKLFLKIPDRVTGRRTNFEKEFFRFYGLKNVANQIEEIKKENLKRYLGIIICFVILIVMAYFSNIMENKNDISIDSKGRVYVERPAKKEGNVTIPLIVYGKADEQQLKKVVTLTVRPEGSNRVAQKKIQEEKEDSEIVATASINQFIHTFNKSDSGKFVYLPNKLSGIEGVSWEAKESNSIVIIMLIGIIVIAGTYLGRYNSTKKLRIKCEESIARELPEFLNKIVLLMNAGLVLSTAFERIIQDYGSRQLEKQSYFYNQLEEIHTKIFQVNSSMIVELKLFAERSRNREFMRLMNIMADNLNKGTELVNKLQAESTFLWFERKKQAEEKGKLAETKLTIPLAIQLLVLIMITVAPALMDM